MTVNVLAYVAAGFTILLLLAWRFDEQKPDTHGSARWSPVWKLFRKGLFSGKGIRVGDWAGRLSVFFGGPHAITFGAAGAGKGTTAILPNLLSYPFVFLIDPGGENTAVAAKHWQNSGMPFGCINLFSMFTEKPWALPAHGFNPLDNLDPGTPSFAADATVIAEMLTPRDGKESSSTAYFKAAAQDAKRAMILHIKTAEPARRQNLGTLFGYVNSDAGEWGELLKAMMANASCGGLVRREAIKLDRIEAQAPQEFSAILSTIQQELGFLADPLIREKLSRSDVDFSTLKGHDPQQTGGIISVILPLEYLHTHAAIPRLAMACAILTLQRLPLPRKNVLFLIDEAAALGHIVSFANWLATLRKYRVMIWSIWQNIGQVVHLYQDNWQTIISNCALVQILNVSDLQTAQYIQNVLGQCTVESQNTNERGEVSRTQTARPLLMADELMRLEENRQIAFIDNLHPVKLAKTPYWKRPELQGRFHPNPYVEGQTPLPGPGDYYLALWGMIYYALAWFMAPHRDAALLILAALLVLAMPLIVHAF